MQTRVRTLRAAGRRAARALTARADRDPGQRAGTRFPSGRGGATGTPSADLDEAPPSLAQETNWVVSGGGLVSHDGTAPRRTRRSR